MSRYLDQLQVALAARGVDAAAVVLGDAEDEARNRFVAGSADANLVARTWRFAKAASQAGPDADVVDAHFALYSVIPLNISLRRRPIVVHFHGPWAQEGRAERGTNRFVVYLKTVIERLTYGRARRIIVLSAAFKQILVDSYRVTPERVVVIPPGVDLKFFQPGSMAEARRQLGLPEAGHVIGAVRRFTPRMGLETLVRAWAIAALDGAVLVMVGTGPDRARIERLAADLGCADSVWFLGRLSDTDVAALYRAADLTIVPSNELEGYGLVVLESLASGTPVIASDSGGLAEALAGFSEQLVFPAGDAACLSKLIAGALAGRVAVPSAAECRARASSHAWDQIAARHVKVYWDAIGHQPMPSMWNTPESR